MSARNLITPGTVAKHTAGGAHTHGIGKVIVIGAAPKGRYSWAYAPHVRVCSYHGTGRNRTIWATEVSVDSLTLIGKAKRVPAACKRAVEDKFGKAGL